MRSSALLGLVLVLAPALHGETAPAPEAAAEHTAPAPAEHASAPETPAGQTHAADAATAPEQPAAPQEPAKEQAEPSATHASEPAVKTEDHATSPDKPAAQETEHAAAEVPAHAAPHGEKGATPHDTVQGAAHGKEAGAATAEGHGEGQKVPEEIVSMQAAELLKYAEKAYEDGRFDTAIIAYKQLLSMKLPKAQVRTVLLGFGRSHKKRGDLTKAAAIYERIIKDFPADAETPELYLELGRIQRALGAYKTAITRFYNVINSTIKLPQDGAVKYRQLAKTAQFEIAETYFISGDYKEASRFYSRLRLLDLAPVDRARAHFKAAYATQLGGDLQGALTQLRSFVELNPDDENVPEARYLISTTLRKINRSQEALMEALELLRTEKTRTAQDPKRWAYWQRKTGNQIANEFYEQGDANNALLIYLSLIELSTEPSWRTPILYQIALCQERLGRNDKAIENYKSILDIAAAQKGDELRKADYADLARMANWRLSQIEWVHSAEQRLNTLLPNISSDPAPAPPPSPTTK